MSYMMKKWYNINIITNCSVTMCVVHTQRIFEDTVHSFSDHAVRSVVGVTKMYHPPSEQFIKTQYRLKASCLKFSALLISHFTFPASFNLTPNGVMGWLSWYSVRLEIQRTEVQFLSGAQEKFVRVFLSQKCCADSLSVSVPNP